MIRVAITGGIGSGKSTVCALLAGFGAPVYDSDSEARRLMNDDPELRSRIVALFGSHAYGPEGLNRRHIASQAFGNDALLQQLNAAVHPAVMRDFDAWCLRHESEPYTVFESAILFEAGLAERFDVRVAVVAPLPLRLERTCRRDNATPVEVERRIAAQMSDDELASLADCTVVNIDREMLESDVAELDRRFRKMAAGR